MARQRQMALTRERGIAAARKLWAEPGSYDGVTVRDIAAEMGMTTGGIYARFGDKEGLWRAAFDDTPPPVDSALTRAAPAMDEALRRLLELRGRPESDPELAAAWEAAEYVIRGSVQRFTTTTAA